MGGFGSGPHGGGRATVEDGLTLNLYTLLREPGRKGVRGWRTWSGEVRWSRSGEPLAHISYTAELCEFAGNMRLQYKVGRAVQDYAVDLVTTSQPFGGRRWWFECPHAGERVPKLYLPAGATMFASRRAYGLAYQSQRESAHDRTIRRVWKQRHALGSTDPIGDDIPRRKWRHNRTHSRDMAYLRADEATSTAQLWLKLVRMSPETASKAVRAIPDLHAARAVYLAEAKMLARSRRSLWPLRSKRAQPPEGRSG